MIIDHPLISQRYFFPLRVPLSEPFKVQANGAVLSCYYCVVDPEAMTLVHFHGNGEVVADYLPSMADIFAAMGVNVFFAEYRGYGGSTGIPALGTMLGDTQHIFEALGVPQENIIVFGRSVGSIYAIEWIARYPQAAGLILDSGIADPLERLLLRVSPQEMNCTMEALQQEVDEYLDHEKKLSSYEGNVLILHAKQDSLVRISHAEQNYTWVKYAASKKLVAFERGDHNSIFYANQQDYLSEVQTFVGALRPR